MLVDKVIELPGGAVKFQGELSPEETNYVLTLGLSILLLKGAMPYVVEDGEEANVTPQTGTIQ